MNGRLDNHKSGRLPPALELEVMKVLWASPEDLSVAQVQSALGASRPLAYTTVLTLLGRLHRKGFVERRKQGRSYVYRPLMPQEEAVDLALERLLRDFFDNSRERLISHLDQTAEPSGTAEPTPAPLDSALL
jgi:predicted transcriptional regulator